jgi:type II secretory pathway pseudopilin PulG
MKKTILESLNLNLFTKNGPARPLTLFSRKRTKLVGGFTLVELMVSIGVFIFILSATMGALLSIVNLYRKTQTLHVASDSINLALEDISRNLIQGTSFYCDKTVTPLPSPLTPRSCSTINNDGATSIVFSGGSGQIVYWLDTTSHEIKKDIDGVTVGKLTTGSVIVIDELRFRVFAGEGTQPNDQPRVIINIRGTVPGAGDTSSTFEVQTTVVQRMPK